MLVALTSVIAQCTNRNAIADAQFRGQLAGREDGWKAGDAEGFAEAFPIARRDAYRSTLKSLYESDEFHRKRLWVVLVLAVSFISGLLLQYLLLYLARRWGVPDIDRIVLPRDLTEVDLGTVRSSDKQRAASRITSLLILLAVIPSLLTRCENPVENAYKVAYKANYDAAYPEGWANGESRGRTEGTAAGTAAAHQAAANGEAWQLYWRLAAAALAAGLIVGLALQYTILFACRRSGRLGQFSAVVLVPAMKQSLTYFIFENCRKLEIEKQEALQRVHADSAVKKAQLEAAYEASRRRIRAATNIQDLAGGRIVELADEEFARIISSADDQVRN